MSVDVVHAINALNSEYFRHFTDEAVDNSVLLSRKDQIELIKTQSITNAIQIWEHLPQDVAAEVLVALPDELALQCLQKGDSVHAARVIKRLPHDQHHYYQERLDTGKRQELEILVQYPEDSAGTLMDVRFLPLYEDISVREALHRIRKSKPKFSRYLFLLDEQGKLKSRVGIQQLALADGDEKLANLCKPVLAAVVATATREEVVEQFEVHKVTDLPVVDVQGRLLGVILHDVLVNESLKETSLDILTMVGVSKDERGLSSVGFVVQKRLPWLLINLATAFLAASVVGIFESTIAQFTALAVLLPVVAGQSGNTGAQALAVTMRGLALREIGVSHWWRVARKETGAGFINGIAIALTTALGVLVWSGSIGLAMVIAISMVISMILAGISGVIIPVLLLRVGQDPASSSSIILTTVTDVVGFFSFLGIATLLSSML